MRRHAITAVFAAMAVAIGAETAGAVGEAVRHGAAADWLVVGYGLLKLTVALAFTAFVVMRAPARRRAREPIAYLACAGAIVPVALQAPTGSAAPGVVFAGELLALLGCGWMLVAALALGRCFGVLPEARGLVTTGPYQLVRHPLYLGEFAAMAGLLVASPSARNLAAGAAFGAAQATRMWLEERALEREFPEYRAYAARTPRIVPALRRPAIFDRVPAGETGTTLAEYAPILGIVAVMVAVVLTPLGAAVANLLTPVVQAF
jgi:protein-S-isoprenylcysteine O-methyltransferase Ste14/Flp pilus assembly pilin Flp